MKSFGVFTIGILVLCVAFSFIFFRTQIMNFFFDVRTGVTEKVSDNFDYNTCKALFVQNEAQKSLLETPLIFSPLHLDSKYKISKTETYSRYPFNDKNLIVIQGGTDDHFAVSMPVLFTDGVLVGRITNVLRTQSEVQTIFDPSWKSSVYIGSSKIKAVLQGGENPTLEFIPNSAPIKEGDSILNSSPDFPLNLFIGTVSSITTKEHALWTEASVHTNYSFEDIRNVSVITNFP